MKIGKVLEINLLRTFMSMKKQRLDDFLIKNNHVKDKNEAFIIITEGGVFIGGQKAVSPAQLVAPKTKVEVRSGKEYVGRGAYKLEGAIQKFAVSIQDKICADIGAATGGFTEVLLKHGAKKVYAIDTASGKLDLKLREAPRVVVTEKTDVRDLEGLPDRIEVITIDVSLLPLEEILPSVKRLLVKNGEVVALFKPQYQARDQSLLRHGIVKDDATREILSESFRIWATKNNWNILEKMESPIQGSRGNTEYLLHLRPF